MSSAFCSLESRPSEGGPDGSPLKVPLTVEVQLKQGSKHKVDHDTVKEAVKSLLEGLVCLSYRDHQIDRSSLEGHPFLEEHVESLTVCDCDPSRHPLGSMVLFWTWELNVYVFQLSEEEPEDDDAYDGPDGDEEPTSMYREWPLPSKEIHGLWDALHYDCDEGAVSSSNTISNFQYQGGGVPLGVLWGPQGDIHQNPQDTPSGALGIKRRLLKYSSSALLFSERNVSPNMVSWNRVVLLHGPPGTGKTSLCKALAQKLAIRFGSRYAAGCSLVEVNAHSLFSKYFSESGKLVGRLFTRILELVEDGDSLVFVLLDEVESLTAARRSGGSEPTDSIRAVNALLTQLDQLRRFPNIMVLTTSNLTGSIDAAFIDRADIKAFIGPPSLQARYKILLSAVIELGRAGIITIPDSGALLDFTEICALKWTQEERENEATGGVDGMDCICQPGSNSAVTAGALSLSHALHAVALACEGLSGRSLRKLPFLAHAAADWMPHPCPAMHFIVSMRATAVKELQDLKDM